MDVSKLPNHHPVPWDTHFEALALPAMFARTAQASRDAPLLHFLGRTYPYRELLSDAQAFAHALRARGIAEGDRVVMTKGDGAREEVDLAAPGKRDDAADQALPEPVSEMPLAAPGASPLDGILGELRDAIVFDDDDQEDEIDERDSRHDEEAS